MRRNILHRINRPILNFGNVDGINHNIFGMGTSVLDNQAQTLGSTIKNSSAVVGLKPLTFNFDMSKASDRAMALADTASTVNQYKDYSNNLVNNTGKQGLTDALVPSMGALGYMGAKAAGVGTAKLASKGLMGFLNNAAGKFGNLLGANNLSAAAGAGIGVAGAVGNILGHKLISDGFNTGTGDTVATVGNMVGSGLSMINPIVGALVSAGTGIIGGGINSAFGVKTNQERLNAAKQGIDYFSNYDTNANSMDDIQDIQSFSLSNPYKGGWAPSAKRKAERKWDTLKREFNAAEGIAYRGRDNNISNLNKENIANYLGSWYDEGGQLNTALSSAAGIDALAVKPTTVKAGLLNIKNISEKDYINDYNNSVNNILGNVQSNMLGNYRAYGGFTPAVDIMQNNAFLDTINRRSDALEEKGNAKPILASTIPNTYDSGGNLLKLDFMNDFGTDPIGAVVRYNKGLEDLEAREELLRQGEERAMEYAALKQGMADMQKGVEDFKLTPPNFSINITQDYGMNNIPQAPKIEVLPIQESITRNPELGLVPSPSKAASKRYIYDELPELMKKAGLDVRVSSGYRKAGSVGTAGNRSWHPRHGAVDIVPQGNTTFEDIEQVVLTNPELREYMLTNGYGYLDETDRTPEGKALMKKTGATGNHLHFGRDTNAQKYYRSKIRLNAFGGELGTNGTDFTNGLLYIDEGGSHESNPLDGVPMGLDSEGIPNLVEEGETVYNDYVFSDRLKVPFFMYKELGLGGVVKKKGEGMSFADASKKLAQESEQRPNDPISQAGLEASLSKLAEIQETERMRKQAEEYMGLREYACGGKLGRKYSGTENHPNKLKSYKYDPMDGFKYWDNNTGDYDKGYRDFIENKINEDWINRVMAGNYGDMSRYRGANDFNPTIEQARQLGLDYMNSDWHKAMAAAYDEYNAGINPITGKKNIEGVQTTGLGNTRFADITAPTDADIRGLNDKLEEAGVKGIQTPYISNNPKTYATWMRYMPTFGAGAMALSDMLGLTNKPDYSGADGLEAAARAAGYAPNISYKPIGDYLTYRPMDIWYQQNALNAQARATDRALQNTISPSKAAGLLASGYNSQLASGNLYRQALEYNDAQRERVADFNRKTNMFNSQMGLEADMANARYRQQAATMGLSGLAQAAALRAQIDAGAGAARSANLSNFLTSLGNIGRENFAMNQINTDRSRNYWGNLSGNVGGYKRKNRSCGGKMKRK